MGIVNIISEGRSRLAWGLGERYVLSI